MLLFAKYIISSVLGPILFLIFINDLLSNLYNECRLYADDNKIISPITSEADWIRFQEDINNLDAWSEDFFLKEKTYYSHII